MPPVTRKSTQSSTRATKSLAEARNHQRQSDIEIRLVFKRKKSSSPSCAAAAPPGTPPLNSTKEKLKPAVMLIDHILNGDEEDSEEDHNETAYEGHDFIAAPDVYLFVSSDTPAHPQ